MGYSFSRRAIFSLAASATLALAASGCMEGEVIQRGFVVDDEVINKLRPGVDAQSVLSQVGTPSTVSTVGNKTWYYISQTTSRRLAFMKDTIVEQRVLAVYFDKNLKIERVANYGLEDGKVFDFITRSTPTSGQEQSFVRNLLRGLGTFNPFGV